MTYMIRRRPTKIAKCERSRNYNEEDLKATNMIFPYEFKEVEYE